MGASRPPIDFLGDDIPAGSAERLPQDFLMEDTSPPEDYSTSLGLAIPRAAKDVAGSAWDALQSIPGLYQSAKTEVPGLVNSLYQHPASVGKQALAGLAEQGQKVFNYPHDVVNYLSQRLHLIPEDVNKMVQMGRMPEDTGEMISQTFGEPQYPGEKLARGVARNVLPLLSGRAAIQGVAPLVSRRAAARPYGLARKSLGKKGITHITPPQGLIDDARQFLPNTEANRRLLEGAESGHINSLFSLQSDLGRVGASYASNPFSAAERAFGRAGLDTREALLGHTQNELRGLGLHREANLLEQGRNQYRRYHALKWPRRVIETAGAGYLASQLGVPHYAKNILLELLK